MIKKILVPVDFSKNARQAFNFAREIAKPLNAILEVVHYCLPKGATASDNPPRNIKTLIRRKAEELENFIQSDDTNQSMEGVVETALMIKTKIKAGFASLEIVADSKSGEYDMIIMGTTGTGGFLKKIFGSVSLDVLNNAGCPVVLVPPKMVYKGIEKIVYATNRQAIQKDSLSLTKNLAENLSAELNFVHISTDEKREELQFEEFILEKLLLKKSPKENYQLKTVQSDTIWQGLSDYGLKNNVGLIAMVTQERSFFEGFLHKSQTKEAITHIPIPLLILHTQ